VRHTCFEQLLGRGNNFRKLIDGGPEFLLQVADTGQSQYKQWRRVVEVVAYKRAGFAIQR
jgi:hypothetical protein